MRRLKCAIEMLINRTRSRDFSPGYAYLILSSFLFSFQYNNIWAQDLLITDNVIFEDTTIVLNGNLIVKAGGSLTLNSVTLKMNCQFDGQFKIEVEADGKMFIYDSTEITCSNLNYGYAFAVHGSAFEMMNSEVHGAGLDKGITPENKEAYFTGEGGLYVETENAVIDSNIFSENIGALIVNASGVQILNNRFFNNKQDALIVFKSSNGVISNNYIEHGTDEKHPNICSLFNITDYVISENTIISGTHRGVMYLPACHRNLIENNTITGLGVGIFLSFLSNDNIIRNNTIKMDEVSVVVWGWNNIIENNEFSADGTGIYAIYAYNTLIENNRLFDMGTMHGIWLRHSSNNKIYNNVISSSKKYRNGISSGICLFRNSSHNIIKNNIMSDFEKGISFFYGCDNNYYYGNQILSTVYEGMILDGSKNNYIYSNNQMTDTGNPNYSNSKNYWNYKGTLPVDNHVDQPKEITAVSFDAISENTVFENQNVNLAHIGVSPGMTLTFRNMVFQTGRAKDDVSGVDLPDGATLILENCKFIHHKYGNGFQFWADEGSTLIMKNCELYDCGHEWWYGGLQIQGCKKVVLENNKFYGTTIRFQTNDGKIINNEIYDSFSAINLDGSNIEISGNIIKNSAWGAIRGGHANISIQDNQISNIWGEGIHPWNTTNALIKDNIIFEIHAPFRAIDFWGANINVTHNRVSNSYLGINCPEFNFNSIIEYNNVSYCEYGFTISPTNIVRNNTVTNCTLGIEADSVINNVVSNCIEGIYGNVITNNYVNDCILGIQAINENIITENLVIDCQDGIVAHGAGNRIYNNAFIDNSNQAYGFTSGDNYWDYNGMGNYWSDYTGSDADGDGIGDTPYTIENQTSDMFPLMAPLNKETETIYCDVKMADLTPTQILENDSTVVIASITMQKSAYDSSKIFDWIGLRLDRIGNGVDGDVSSIKIWRDINNNSTVENEADSLLGSGIFKNGTSYISLNSNEIITIIPSYYLISIDVTDYLSADANKIGISFIDSTSFICKFPAKVKNSNFPFSTKEILITGIIEFELPISFSLSQNYPNPFNPTTRINYSIPMGSFVSIKVYDLLGREVATLVNEEKPRGNYNFVFDGGNLSCGIYFYRIHAGDFVKTKKLALIK